jgi:hypothetical protein
MMTSESPSPNGSNGRGPRGRFGKGNPGGPGNPYAARVGRWRATLAETVTDTDMQAVAKALVKAAKAGERGKCKCKGVQPTMAVYYQDDPQPARPDRKCEWCGGVVEGLIVHVVYDDHTEEDTRRSESRRPVTSALRRGVKGERRETPGRTVQ